MNEKTDKVITTEEIEQGKALPEKPKPNFFEFGDAFFECNRCGNYERIQKGIKDGLQFVLPTSDQHEWRLVCGKCKNMMRIFFKESDEQTIIEAKKQIEEYEAQQKKQAEEAALEKAKKEQDESKNKGKKKGSRKGSSKDMERETGTDPEGDAPIASAD